MDFFPRTTSTRPRLACEVRTEGVVAARAEDGSALLAAVSRVVINGVWTPHVRAGEATGAAGSKAAGQIPAGASGGAGHAAAGVVAVNPAERAKLVAAVKSTLEHVSAKGRDVTLVVPDAAARVLLLDFDELPPKAAEALPVVRFRLKKMLPFDADDAAVSYQVMSSARAGLQVLAVAMPREVLAEYEGVVREAGFEPGAVLPSTLAALAGLGESEMATLVVNAGGEGVTTAIVKGGMLLLHRTVDLSGDLSGDLSTDLAVSEAEARLAGIGRIAASGGAAQPPMDLSISAIAARLEMGGRPAPVSSEALASDAEAEAASGEVAQAVSVAAAYFEDTLESAPALVLSAGTLGASALMRVLDEAYMPGGAVAVQELVDRQMLGEGAAAAGQPGGVPLGWLAGVRGALAN